MVLTSHETHLEKERERECVCVSLREREFRRSKNKGSEMSQVEFASLNLSFVEIHRARFWRPRRQLERQLVRMILV